MAVRDRPSKRLKLSVKQLAMIAARFINHIQDTIESHARIVRGMH